jgi:hypothetical protein
MTMSVTECRDADRLLCTIIDRLNAQHGGLKKKRATDAALDMLVGALRAWEITGQTALFNWASTEALLVSVRGAEHILETRRGLLARMA